MSAPVSPKPVRLIIALALPIVALLLLGAYKHYVVTIGREFTLPITGFDPRDLLSGHYVTYRIDYGVQVCGDTEWDAEDEAFVCLDSPAFQYYQPDCKYYVEGECHGTRFKAGIEKFFIPESRAQELDTAVRRGKGTLVIAVTRRGGVSIKELLIDGVPYKQRSP